MGEKRIVRRLFVKKPEGNKPLGRSKRRWVDNIKMDLGEIGWSDIDWTDLAQNRDQWKVSVSTVMNILVHKMLGIS
jgi:hypothetical protein